MRKYIIIAWLAVVAISFSLYFFKVSFFQEVIQSILLYSLTMRYSFFLLMGCLRGFTLIPSTSLIVLGLLFFSPLPLFILIMAGILVSSASVYYFSEALHLNEFFIKKHKSSIEKITRIIQKNELPLIIGWSFFPFLPTDVICYVCGTLKINFSKFITGVFVGEAITCSIYIFGGSYLLHLLPRVV